MYSSFLIFTGITAKSLYHLLFITLALYSLVKICGFAWEHGVLHVQCPMCCFQSINMDASIIAVRLHVQGTEIIYVINFNVFPCMKFRFFWDSSHEHVLKVSVDAALTLSTCMAVLLTWNWNSREKMPFPCIAKNLNVKATFSKGDIGYWNCVFLFEIPGLSTSTLGDKGIDFHMRIMLILWQAFGHPFCYTYQHWTLSRFFFSVNLSLSFHFGFLQFCCPKKLLTYTKQLFLALACCC